MKIIEIRLKVNEARFENVSETTWIAEEIKDYIYDDYSDVIDDVTYEIRDDYQE